ncbi:MAG TPA: hypothetical protein VIK01_28675 [Polyangiaceae bacterium]
MRRANAPGVAHDRRSLTKASIVGVNEITTTIAADKTQVSAIANSTAERCPRTTWN